MGYNLKCHKNTFYGLTIHLPVFKIKKHLWANGFKSPVLACVSYEFFSKPPWECKQLRDPGGHPEYIIRFQQTVDGYLKTFGWKRKTEWTTFKLSIYKDRLEISSIKNAN